LFHINQKKKNLQEVICASTKKYCTPIAWVPQKQKPSSINDQTPPQKDRKCAINKSFQVQCKQVVLWSQKLTYL
jgi:hypothetical protein